MTTTSAPVSVTSSTVVTRVADPIWSVPLAPVALALTLGIVVDQLIGVLLPFSLGVAVVCVAGWIVHSRSADSRLALLFLWGGVAGFGCAYHQWYRDAIPPDDIRRFARQEPQPVRLIGVLASEPATARRLSSSLHTFPMLENTKWTLRARRLLRGSEWRPVSGLVHTTVTGTLHSSVHVGDVIEVVGNLSLPPTPANPGEFDYAEFLRDQGIGAVLAAPAAHDSVLLVQRGWPASILGWLAVVRGWGKDVLAEHIEPRYLGLAWALLLGDSSRMTGEGWEVDQRGGDWEGFQRTGVMHVLAISGQHLVVLAGFLWLALRLGRCSRRRGALAVAILLLAYALITGGRPPVMRAAWTGLAYCGGMLLGRRVLPANVFALAWIGVLIVNPTDAFNTGCQLSFLAVAILFWGVSRWQRGEPDALQQLIEESRPIIVNGLARLGRWLLGFYVLNALVWLGVAPLVAARFHTFSPVALIIGPPVVIISSIALLAGFVLLLTAAWLWPLAALFALVTQVCLAVCDLLVHWSVNWPGAYIYLADIPDWWLLAWYGGLLSTLTVTPVWRWRWWMLLAASAWVCLLFHLHLAPLGSSDFRCTFVAVGHGGCTVIETSDGQVLLYDAGAMNGPDVTRRHIAPFLWQRGYRRLDEVILSHADLDHFNGLPALLDRFAVGRVTLTPSFADRPSKGVRLTLDEIGRHRVPTRIVKAGDHWETGDVQWEVLHPPAIGPEGKENARSLVLRLQRHDLSILLTGDLEEPGLSQVLALPKRPVSILMAPHHGSAASNTTNLAKWAQPQIVVSNEGPTYTLGDRAKPYRQLGADFLSTWEHGAVTLRRAEEGWIAETFRTRERMPVRQAISLGKARDGP